MSGTTTRRKRPLVYARPMVLERSRRMLPEVVLEVAVQAAIERGDVCSGAAGGFVFLNDYDVVARVRREPGRMRPKPRAWAVVDLQQNWNRAARAACSQGRRNRSGGRGADGGEEPGTGGDVGPGRLGD